MMTTRSLSLLIAGAVQTQSHPSITDGFTAAEMGLLIGGGILTLAILGFFIFLFLRASKEQ